jgi:organic radical activating enzyme
MLFRKQSCNAPLMEEFYTIQGEGFIGTAAYFVRIEV